ncbi:hypothetical protein [Sphingobium herbicidovorans]|uniref:hypothetical protein n=1 Tax=Sphingobium herbicidovorans TaxID=76947 RepID=UPI002351D8D6|nr:hypothetical protein [Sphingobium herbicidovorans]
MVQRVPALPRGFDKHTQIFTSCLLPDKLCQRFWSQRRIYIFDAPGRCDQPILAHARLSLSLLQYRTRVTSPPS